jgi:hydrogenase maturation protease
MRVNAPLLIFGWGNLSRGDDAIGPMFVQRLRILAASHVGASIELLEDYQLQIEHALDLAEREHVLFVDASVSCAAPFEVTALRAVRDATFTTHAVSPQSVMQVYADLYGAVPPPCTLLAIRGMRFELGEPPGDSALASMAQAITWTQSWLEARGVAACTEDEVAHA